MRIHNLTIFMIFITLFLAQRTYAAPGYQDYSGELPPTAAEAVTLLVAAVAVLWTGGTLGNIFTEQLKKLNFGFLVGEEARLGGLLAEAAALLLSVGSAYLLSQALLPFGQFLDHNGLYVILIAAWPVARMIYSQRKVKGIHNTSVTVAENAAEAIRKELARTRQ